MGVIGVGGVWGPGVGAGGVPAPNPPLMYAPRVSAPPPAAEVAERVTYGPPPGGGVPEPALTIILTSGRGCCGA